MDEGMRVGVIWDRIRGQDINHSRIESGGGVVPFRILTGVIRIANKLISPFIVTRCGIRKLLSLVLLRVRL